MLPITAPLSVLTACSLLTLSTNAFIFKTPLHNALVFSYRHGSRINTIRSKAGCTCANKGVSLARTPVWGRVVAGGVGDTDIFPSSWKSKRTSTAATRRSGAKNDGQWEPLTPTLAGRSPEEMMRQMSIPDLARKLDEAESTFGAVHPRVASTLIPLAQALFANGDLAPARETCTRALKILQVAYGNTPTVDVAECLHTLAMIQQAENPEVGDKALGSQKMAYELVLRVCGTDSIEVAAYARCLAQMSEDYSQNLVPGLPRPFYMPDPVPLYRQTLRILEKLLGPSADEVASAIDDLASSLLFWRSDDSSDESAVDFLPETEALATRSLEISRACLGAEDQVTAGREHNLGMVKRALRKDEEASVHFKRALEIREKVLGPDDPLTQQSRQVLDESQAQLAPADDESQAQMPPADDESQASLPPADDVSRPQ